MRLLVFYPYIPWPLDRGTHHRTFHLLRELARVHTVDLFALAENGEGMEHKQVFEEFCERVDFMSFKHPAWQKLFPQRLLNPLPPNVAHWTIPGVAEHLDRLLARDRYDAVHICDLILTQYFIHRHRDVPIIIDRSRVDLQFQWMEHARMNFPLRTRLLRYEGYAKLWFYERLISQRAKMEVVCGPDDEKFLRHVVRRNMPIKVIPNGVDLDYFYPDACPSAHRALTPTILFCGAMDYNPNIDALRWYFREIHDSVRKIVPELRVLIVGKAPAAEVLEYGRKENVLVTGGVPDVRPYYRQAWLQIVPLRIGGGTRLKIVESLAMGTPVVSTTIGAQGLDLCHECDILLADTAEEFAEQTVRALCDSKLRQSLEQSGLETVSQRLSWKTLGRQLSSVYTSLFPSPATVMDSHTARA
jgi:polysaccharide biosynthesis protein PslH